MKILGIDYGQKHLGFAIVEDSPLAVPLASTTLNEGELAVTKTAQVIKVNHPDRVVVGVPEGRLTDEVQEFARSLQESTGVPTFLHPETLSTKEALSKLRESGASRKKLREDHSYAACLILEDYLESI